MKIGKSAPDDVSVARNLKENDLLPNPPSGASFVKAHFCLRPIRDDVSAALVHYGDATQGPRHFVHGLWIGVTLGLHVRPLEDGLAEAAELHGVGSEDGLRVAADQARRVDQVPEAVGVDDQRDVGRLHLKRKKTRKVPPVPWPGGDVKKPKRFGFGAEKGKERRLTSSLSPFPFPILSILARPTQYTVIIISKHERKLTDVACRSEFEDYDGIRRKRKIGFIQIEISSGALTSGIHCNGNNGSSLGRAP